MDIMFFVFLSSGLFLGWSLGANDAANIFGTAVGSRMLKFNTAAIIASVFIILGAVYAGSGASQTLGQLGSINALAGAFMVALSAAVTVYWMLGSGIPVSTSQAIVGAIVGWNIYSGKPTDLDVLKTIASTWVICPILSAVIAFLTYFLVRKVLRRSHMHLLRQDCYVRTGLIVIAAFGAYALGANNIANVMGVFVSSSPFNGIDFNGFSLNGTQILFFIGAISICVGVFTYSQKTIRTIGNNLMSITPAVAWIVVFAQSLVLFLFASVALKNFLLSHGLPALPLVPVSSSQAVVGAIMGVGIAKGGRNISWMTIGKISIGWVTTPVIAAGLCFISLFFLENVFNQTVFLP